MTAALVQFVINRVASNDNDKSYISKCLKCFLYYKDDYCPESSTGNEVYRGTKKRSNNNSSIGTESNSNSNDNSNVRNSKDRASKENSILVGDSRVDSICNVPLSQWDTDYSGDCTDRNMLVVAHGGKGHDWFRNTAVPLINNLLSNNSSKKYNIVFFMGLGNLGLKSANQAEYTASQYMDKIIEQINSTWKKHHVIIVSLTDIGDDKVYAGGAWADREAIAEFNGIMKKKVENSKLDNMEYCDISYLDVKNDTKDKIHYKPEGDDKIYKEIVSKCLK